MIKSAILSLPRLLQHSMDNSFPRKISLIFKNSSAFPSDPSTFLAKFCLCFYRNRCRKQKMVSCVRAVRAVNGVLIVERWLLWLHCQMRCPFGCYVCRVELVNEQLPHHIEMIRDMCKWKQVPNVWNSFCWEERELVKGDSNYCHKLGFDVNHIQLVSQHILSFIGRFVAANSNSYSYRYSCSMSLFWRTIKSAVL